MGKTLSVFKYLDYQDFLESMIKENRSSYGYKAQLAEAAGCQRSYLSQVLSRGSIHFTIEHAVALAGFWNLSEPEKDYFINLVLFARAGTKALKDHLKKKLETARQDQENLTKRITEQKTILPEASASIFYSNWLYLAIAILLTIPAYRNPRAIALRLGLKEDLIRKSLEQLEHLQMALKDGSDWRATQNTIHVPNNSPFNALNHSHWRSKAVENAFALDLQSVHYTSVCSVSLSDAEKIKQLVFQLVDDSRKIVSPSKEEELFCLTCDWFKV